MQVLIAQGKVLLNQRIFLWLLFIVNLLGTIYGYYWYVWQLQQTKPIYWIFVPDSPTATLFFTIAILGWLFGKHFKLMEALAFITLIKYGVWAVAMNLFTVVEIGNIGAPGWMLVCSHSLMAVQALLYIGNYKFTWIHVCIVAIWTLHNDVIDYLFGQMPIYHVINSHVSAVGYFTFWLSICCLVLALFNVKKRKALQQV